jgi:hypothetical protein
VAKLAENIQSEPLCFDPSIKISQESQFFLIEALQVNENERLSWLEVF